MTDTERFLFEMLRHKREELAKAMNDPAVRNAWIGIEEKYSDQAHFIYELLQNADDAGADEARFELRAKELLFFHNGTRQFSITPVFNEEVDAANRSLGDVNAITSVGNSNKTSNEIGKFGVGFKAVFQYTKTPHIYDRNFSFRIENRIVPVLIDDNHLERGDDETLFVFPFDNPKINRARAEHEIAGKLASLVLPTLFLKHLRMIRWRHGTTVGSYEKVIGTPDYVIDEQTKAEFVMTRQNGLTQRFWLFTRSARIETIDLDYSVGFSIDRDKLLPTNYNAFCFFPTKEKTGLNFVVHAPFLLNDSRESIRADKAHNRIMIRRLAELAADALVFLKNRGAIDDDILKIIPIDPTAFTALDSRDQISFLPFFDEIKKTMQSEAILPVEAKKYVPSRNAYWARSMRLTELFSNEQLRLIVENPNSAWVFTSIGEQHVGGSALNKYIRELVVDGFEDENLLPKIAGAFIEAQSIAWLKKFYRYLTATELRMRLTRTLPIFLDRDGKAAAAFDLDGRPSLFLPSDVMPDYRTVDARLFKDKEIRELLAKFGLRPPSLRDEIHNKILPMYSTGSGIATIAHVKIFLRYCREASFNERAQFIKQLKEYKFVRARSSTDGNFYRCLPCQAYFYSVELEKYFGGVKRTYFVRLADYEPEIPKREHAELQKFLLEVGVSEEAPRLVEYHFTREEAQQLKLPRFNKTIKSEWIETRIEGFRSTLRLIEMSRNKDRARLLWRMLLKVFERDRIDPKKPEKILGGRVNSEGGQRASNFPSTDIKLLRQTRWLLDRDGEFRKPNELNRETLSKEYARDERLLEFLQIPAAQMLTPEQLRKLALADRLLEKFSSAELEKMIRERNEAHAEEARPQPTPSIEHDQKNTPPSPPPLNQLTLNQPPLNQPPLESPVEKNASSSTDYDKQLDALEKKYASERQKLDQKKAIAERAATLPKYSYEWFTTLLELEKLNAEESDGREISIGFRRVEREPGTERIVVLKYPSRSIPQFIEEITDVNLELYRRGEQVGKPLIDAISIRSFTLRVKLKQPPEGIDLDAVDEARIDAVNPIFLLQELINSFNALALKPTFDMKKNLPPNLEFVFGPPGTGKTTYLARETLIPLMKFDLMKYKVLVLTPTNKAADVLAARIISQLEKINDRSYTQWLIRFGSCNDETLEARGIVYDSSLDIKKFRRRVLITTIARFPYDYFINGNNRLPLKNCNWDYIVIDEASMIPIANIIYSLYRLKDSAIKFIIAGDPLQIEPITKVEQWKDENIYSMVGLKSFGAPKTEPRDYPVKLLTTQYRSIPTVGEIFSRFAYDGVLNHYRKPSEQKPLDLPLPIKTLNIIKFPVKKYESIYRAKRLNGGSPYHLYAALFTFEFVRYLIGLISKRHPTKKFSIGIITPFRAEGDLINKLSASIRLPSSIELSVGTIHGFQGDECDIVFVMFNPPPSISNDPRLFLNKLNILNVAISRARDYLFVVMPDDQTEKVEQLFLVKRIETLLKSTSDYNEIMSSALEKMMFDSTTFIEENAFSTAHQSVNIYGSTERRYEIRSEETAVDIQLHKGV